MIASERLQQRLKKIYADGVSLMNAMQVEQFPERMEDHFKSVLKKDYAAFTQTLPVFHTAYQAWYSETQLVIKRYLPGRLNDFVSLYEPAKGRKDIRQDNYVIEDYLKDITVTTGFDKKVMASPKDAVPCMQQQLNIFHTVFARTQSMLADSQALLQAELLDAELRAAEQLLKKQFVRSAGAICGVALEKHLQQLMDAHQLKSGKKSPSIKDFNELFKKEEIYDFGIYRHIQYLWELIDLSVNNKKEMPTIDQVADLIEGVRKIVKTVT